MNEKEQLRPAVTETALQAGQALLPELGGEIERTEMSFYGLTGLPSNVTGQS
jgi:hypothetical protein